MSVNLSLADPHDQHLLTSVHPPDWINPRPAPRYHLVVIGAGTAGLVTAAIAAGLGARVALVERHLMGGDCLNVGCVPSKALIRAARAVDDIGRAREFGVRAPEAVVDFPAIMDRVRRLRAQLGEHDSAQRFRDLGVDVFFGKARFTSGTTVEVDGQTLPFRRAVIATGTRPTIPNIVGLSAIRFLTNETVFTLTALPQRLAIVGGGPIGCELAQAFARFGSKVTLLQRGSRLLPRDDADGAHLITQALERDGVAVLAGAALQEIGSDRHLTFEHNGVQVHLVVDDILIAAGRTPNVDLDLEAAGVVFDPCRGVQVNDRLQTSNRNIFAAGDICSTFKFTHAADAMARLVVRNALFCGRGRLSRLSIPWCTYTDPEIAHVGLTDGEARRQGFQVTTWTQRLEQVDRAVLDGETAGFIKVHTVAGKDRILGATIVARHAGDMIAEINLARSTRVGLGTLSSVIHPYPTQAEALRKVGDQYLRTRLTPLAKWLLKKWLRFRL